jgi:CRISPR-associated protein Cst2
MPGNNVSLNLFATVLTYPAPTANYRGESELNRTVIQKVTDGRFEYPIISPEAMRNALREALRNYGLPSNRSRLEPVAGEGEQKQQLAVTYAEFPDPNRFIDDFLFGYLLAVKGKDLEKVRKERGKDFPLKRDSVLRMNLAKGLEPYRHDAVFTQSPQFKNTPWKEDRADTTSALLHRETAVTAFQYPFALAGVDCKGKPDWVRSLLRAIGELSDVAGNHARSYYEMAPASVSARLTPMLVTGHDTYHFRLDGRGPDNERRVGSSLLRDLLDDELNLPGDQFHLGGQLVRDLPTEVKSKLTAKNVSLEADPRRLLESVADKFLGDA